jgi:glycosyltransferase involved in cell wall biosynthesis
VDASDEAPAASERTTLVVPCFDEAERLRPGVFAAFADGRPWLRFLFVDDGSRDATDAVLAEAVARWPACMGRMRLAENRGKGEAVRAGLLRALAADPSPAFVGYWDADGATPLDELERLRAALREDPGRIVAMASRARTPGSRIARSPTRHAVGRLAAAAVASILGAPLYDTQCGAKLLRVGSGLEDALREPFLTRWIFDVELLARLAHGLGPDRSLSDVVVELPVRAWRDVPGSRVRARDVLRVPLDLARIARARRRADRQAGRSATRPR